MTIVTYHTWSFRILNNGLLESAPTSTNAKGEITIGEFKERSLEELGYISGYEYDLIRQHLSQMTTQLPPEVTPMPTVENNSGPEYNPKDVR
jgi:hypothetical protein